MTEARWNSFTTIVRGSIAKGNWIGDVAPVMREDVAGAIRDGRQEAHGHES